jgi:hypothetical protein
MSNIAAGLQAIIGETPIVDDSTRTLVYEATHRTSEYAKRYFQQMRTSTALITFETYIWEVNLESDNTTGIQWDNLESFGKFTADINIAGATGGIDNTPISIGLPSTGFEEGGPFTPSDVFSFLTEYGAVKTISQPQVTVLSGSEARLRVADTQNFVSEVTQTIDNGQTSTSVNTSSVDSGFELIIGSNWDNATVYADISINLSTVISIEPFNFQSTGEGNDQTTTQIQLPNTSERELTTQVRMRPGDSLLIAGLVEENDNLDSSGIGTKKPTIPTSRSVGTENNELVFLLRPRVVVYTSQDEYNHYAEGRRAQKAEQIAAAEEAKEVPFEYDFEPLSDQQDVKSMIEENVNFNDQYDGKDRTIDLLKETEVISGIKGEAPKKVIAQTVVDDIIGYDERTVERDIADMTVAEEPVLAAARLSEDEERMVDDILASVLDDSAVADQAPDGDLSLNELLGHGMPENYYSEEVAVPMDLPAEPTGAPLRLNKKMHIVPAEKPNVLGANDIEDSVLPNKKPRLEKVSYYEDITVDPFNRSEGLVDDVQTITSQNNFYPDPS